MRKLFPFVQAAASAIVGVVGLSFFASAVQHRANKANARVERTTSVKSAIRYLVMPRELIDFAKRNREIEDHADLVQRLVADGIEGHWFAIVAIDLLSTGEVSRNAHYVFPASMEHMFPSSKAILERLSGETELSYDGRVYEKAEVVILTREMARLHPATLIGDLIESIP